eukprot:362004-Chlamydomonas_euryale.AAC.6
MCTPQQPVASIRCTMPARPEQQVEGPDVTTPPHRAHLDHVSSRSRATGSGPTQGMPVLSAARKRGSNSGLGAVTKGTPDCETCTCTAVHCDCAGLCTVTALDCALYTVCTALRNGLCTGHCMHCTVAPAPTANNYHSSSSRISKARPVLRDGL